MRTDLPALSQNDPPSSSVAKELSQPSEYKIIYFETTDEVWAAIGREKQIKGWLREKKFALIRTLNPRLRDLSYDFAPPPRRAPARVRESPER